MYNSAFVKIIIPIYKKELSKYEKKSLLQAYTVLNDHSIVVIKPQSLSLDFLLIEFPKLQFESFEDAYFTSIMGYNRLMLSSEFYERFIDSTYILICQLDAYIFTDQLMHWCKQGYDYIGAPWILKPWNRYPLSRTVYAIKRTALQLLNRPNSSKTAFKVGNGGLSLRKVATHLEATVKLKNLIQEVYLTKEKKHLFNEDVFFATEVNNQGLNFKYPTYQEALKFAFDKYPNECYKLNNEILPFGCHSWYKRKMKEFWFPIIYPQTKA